MLFETFMVPCIKLEKQMTADGEGGYQESWINGLTFEAAIVFNNSTEAKAANKATETPTFTITTQTDIPLNYYDVFKRVSDGKIFRLISGGEDLKTPDVATFRFKQFKAEEWRLPND